jgi:hypothetical protein
MKIHLIAILLLPLFALGQKTQVDSTYQVSRQVKNIGKNQIDSKTYSPTVRSSVISSYSDLRLKSDFGDESASATLGFSLDQSSISAYFEQPFKEKPKQVTFFNQEGLQTGTTFKVAFQHTFWNPEIDFAKFDAVRNEYAKRNNITDPQKIRELTLADFDKIANSEIADYMDFGTPVIFGISYGGSKNEINYIQDSSSLAPLNTLKLNQSIQISLGLVLAKSEIIAISYTKEIKFKGADETSVFNFPLPGSNLTYQKEVGIGNPVRKEDNKFQVEYRKLFFKKGVESSLAINPRAFYLTSEKSINLEIPIYFLNYSEEGKVKGLQGGFSIGYSSKLNGSVDVIKGFGVSIFVAAPFDLFNLFKT